jgi:hypothetical protein
MKIQRYHVKSDWEGQLELVKDSCGALCRYQDVEDMIRYGVAADDQTDAERPLNYAYGALLLVLFAIFFMGMGVVIASARCNP